MCGGTGIGFSNVVQLLGWDSIAEDKCLLINANWLSSCCCSAVPHRQVHPYVLPICLFSIVAFDWWPGAWLLHRVEAWAHLPCVQQYYVAHGGKGRLGSPVMGHVGCGRCSRGVVAGWRLLVVVYIAAIICCICCIWATIVGRMESLACAAMGAGLAEGVAGCSSATLVAIASMRLAWWYPASSIVSSPVSWSLSWAV
jgi:hypothetical protein